MIRSYKTSDQPAVMELFRLNTPACFGEGEEEDLLRYLEQELEDYFVIEKNGAITGCGGINYFPAQKLARISWDIIHPGFQNKGLGRELTLFRIERIRKDTNIRSIVVRTSQTAYRFYEKLGFILKRTEPAFWAEGFDLYEMRLELKSEKE